MAMTGRPHSVLVVPKDKPNDISATCGRCSDAMSLELPQTETVLSKGSFFPSDRYTESSATTVAVTSPWKASP